MEGLAGLNHDTTTIARRKYHGRLINSIKTPYGKPLAKNKKGAPPPPGMKHPSNRLMGNQPIEIFYHVRIRCQIFLFSIAIHPLAGKGVSIYVKLV